METQDPGSSLTQELDWRDYDDECCIPETNTSGDETTDCSLGSNSRHLCDLTQTSNLPEKETSSVGISDFHQQSGCSNIDKSMSISDVSTFLLSQGIPKKYCEVFKGKD